MPKTNHQKNDLGNPAGANNERKLPMKNYKHFAKTLLTLLGNETSIRLTSGSYMPLSVEDIGKDGEGNRLISICHYGEQNGDLMRDPDMVFTIHTWDEAPMAEPISFRNDYMGLYQEVYVYNDDGKRTHVRTGLKKELSSFASTWFRNLKDQGFLDKDAKRERLT